MHCKPVQSAPRHARPVMCLLNVSLLLHLVRVIFVYLVAWTFCVSISTFANAAIGEGLSVHEFANKEIPEFEAGSVILNMRHVFVWSEFWSSLRPSVKCFYYLGSVPLNHEEHFEEASQTLSSCFCM